MSARGGAAGEGPARGARPTARLWIGGAPVPAASGELVEVTDTRGRPAGRVAVAGEDDLRSAVAAARSAFADGAGRDAAQRGRVLYRLAELVDADVEAYAADLAATVPGGLRRARAEVAHAVERLVAHAGWCDKYALVLGGQPQVADAFHVQVTPVPVGTVGVLAPDEQPLLALVALVVPPLAVGCTVVAHAAPAHPFAALRLAEAGTAAGLPDGACNLLTGPREGLLEACAAHRGLDALHAAGCTRAEQRTLEGGAAGDLKRVLVRDTCGDAWADAADGASPWWLEPFVETRTLWHPAGG